MPDAQTAQTFQQPGPSAALTSLLNQAIDPTALNQYMAQRQQLGRIQQGVLAQGIQQRNQGLQQIRQATEQSPQLPPLQAAPPAPTAQLTDSINVFGAVAPWLAIFGSLLTRAPMTSAMNAAASAMNGFNTGQREVLKQNLDKWKADTQSALVNNKSEIAEYEAAREKYGDKIDELKAELSALAANNKDHLAMTMIDQGNLDAFFELQQKRLDAGIKIAASLSTIDKGTYGNPTPVNAETPDGKNYQGNAQQNKITGQWVTADENRTPLQVIQPTQTLSPEATKIAATNYLVTGQLPYLGFGPNANRIPILNAAGDIAKSQGLSTQDILSGRVAFKADQSSLSNLQKQADAATSYMQTMEKNIGIVQSLMDKGSGTQAGPVVNRWLQAGRKATGDPDVAAFNAAIQTVMNEYAKVLSGSFGAQGATDSARRETEGMISQFDSPRAIQETLQKTVVPDTQNRIKSYLQQIQVIRGRVGGAPSLGDTAPPSSPAAGDNVQKSKSGRPMINIGGQWYYQ